MEKRVGVYVFKHKIKDKGTRKNNFYDGLLYAGLNSLLLELQDEYSIDYCSVDTIDDYDFVLIPIISYYDICNLLNEFRNKKSHKSKIVIGGPGLVNIRLIKDLIDIAVFGRIEGRIKDVLKGKPFPNVWRKEEDPDLKGIYEFGKVKFLIKNQFIQEKSVGCPKKCAFCIYTWTHEFVYEEKNKSFNSNLDSDFAKRKGYLANEDFFQTFSWEQAKIFISTALDGVTERARKIVFKPITREEFVNKLLDAYKVEAEKRLSVKIFMIIGYPWENEEDTKLQELREDIPKADKKEKEKDIKMTFSFSHFVPSAFTPMEWEGVNLIDYNRDLLHRNSRTIYKGVNFECWSLPFVRAPYAILEEVLIERGYEKDVDIIYNVILNKKYTTLKANQKKEILLKYLPSYIYKKHNIGDELATNYIKRMYNNQNPARVLRKNYEEYMKEKGMSYAQ